MIRLACAFLLLSVWIIGSVGQKQKNCIEVPSGKSCKATYYSGCTTNFLADHYPSLYEQNGVDLGTPNLTISTNDVNDKRGAYSIVNITIYPDKILGTRAFDVNLNSVRGWRCMLVTSKYNDTPSAEQQTRTGYTFRLELNMFTNITVWSVPKSASSRPARMLIRAGKRIVYPPENSSLWTIKIFYKKDWDQQVVRVQFQTAPPEYGIKYYIIHLIPSGTAGLSSRATTHPVIEFSPLINEKFNDVKPGRYRIKVVLFDDLSTNVTSCRCKRNGVCHPCLPTESLEFLMRKTQQNPTDPNMETPILTRVFDVRNSIGYSDWPLETRDFLSRSSDAMTMEPLSMDSSLPDVSNNNSKAGGIFDENIDGSQGSEGEWIAPVSVLSAIGIAVGALVSIFALVFKRGGTSSKSKSAPKKESGPSVTVIHDINHEEHARDLRTSISETLRMNVEVKLFKKKEQLIDKNSESSIFVLWMNPRSFSHFERRLMRNKRIPFVTLMQIQRQLVVIESQMAKGSIQPRIQYCRKFILGSELDLFLDFLRNNTTGECRESWCSDEHTIPKSQEQLQAFKIQYNRMDSGIQSDYENEAGFASYEESIHEECASMSAVTIGEYHLGAPVRHQQKTSASFPLFNYSIHELNGVVSDPRETPSIPCLDIWGKFISPEAMSCVDGSVLSEAIMVLNERNTKQKTASEDSLSLIDERISSYPTSTNRLTKTPVCFHNVIGCSEKEEEFLYEDEDERPDAEEDKLLDEVCVSMEEDILSVGGKSC